MLQKPVVLREGRPSLLDKRYMQNFGAFDTWASKHRSHQIKTLEACKGQRIGQVSLPTGTGKTRVQIHLHAERMIEETKAGRFGVHVIASHRLALNVQLLDEMVEVLANIGVPIDLFFLGSNRYDQSVIYERFKDLGLQARDMSINSGTAGEVVLNAYESAMANKRHLIVASTYHSFERLTNVPAIQMCTYDEAHTVAMNIEFRKNITEVRKNIPVIHNFFFTATRRVFDEVGGMNDRDFFGEVLYQDSPRALIDAGEIVPPKIQWLRPIEDGDYQNYTMTVKSLIEGFEFHKDMVKKYSKDGEKIGAKLLISTTGRTSLFGAHNNQDFQEYATRNAIDVFAFTSLGATVSAPEGEDIEGCFVNFVKCTREETVRKMKALSDDKDAILLHIDILSEGIDLPAITGIMTYRDLGETKLLQTIGRATRLLSTDRVNLYKGDLHAGDYAGFIKPWAWILIPERIGALEDPEALKQYLRTIYNYYKIPVEEILATGNFRSFKDKDLPPIPPRKKSSHLRDGVCDIEQLEQDILFEMIDKDAWREEARNQE